MTRGKDRVRRPVQDVGDVASNVCFRLSFLWCKRFALDPSTTLNATTTMRIARQSKTFALETCHT